MKKLSLILFFVSLSIAAQEKTFRQKYSYCIDKNNVIENRLDLFVVFNHKKTKEIIFYYPRRKYIFLRTSEIVKGKTETGQDYQMFECIETATNEKFTMQLLYKQLRVYYKGTNIIYYY